MRSKASYFNLSGTLIRENLRRFWALSVLSFIGYFLSGILPIIFSYSQLKGMSWQIQQLLNNQYFPYGFLHLVVPVVAAVVLYRYLHSPGSVTMVHGLPLTRAKLFNSNFLSGIILVAVPIIVTAIILLLLAKPVFAYGNSVDLFTTTLVLQWLWQSLIVVLSVYGIGVFAGVVTGNTAMHMLLGFGFNGLLPALYSVCVLYFNEFLFGFDGVTRWVNIAAGIMPYTKAIENQGPFSLGLTLYYIGFFIAILVASSLLYHRRQLEKAGDSLVFKSAGIVICYLITFFGMSMMAFYFNTIPLMVEMQTKGHIMFYFGLIVGILIFLYIGRMIVNKTPRVFNHESLKHLIIYSVIAFLFMATIDLDLTGFEKRVPTPSKVDSVELTDLQFSEDFLRYDPVFFKGLENDKSDYQKFAFSDETNIVAMTDFHKLLLDKRPELEVDENYWNTQSLGIIYNRSGNFDLARRYNIPKMILRESEGLKQVYESREFKTQYSFKNLVIEQPTWARTYNDYLRSSTVDSYGTITINNDKDIEGLMTALEKDFQARTWEQHMDSKAPLAVMELAFTGLPKAKDQGYGYYEEEQDPNLRIMPISIRKSDANTIAWLAEYGYLEELIIKVEDISYITVYHEIINNDDSMYTEENQGYMYEEKYGGLWTDKLPQIRIDDPEEIKVLLDSYLTEGINYEESYFGMITFRKTAPYAASLYNYQSSMNGNQDAIEGTVTVDYYIYFDSENLPEFIKKALK